MNVCFLADVLHLPTERILSWMQGEMFLSQVAIPAVPGEGAFESVSVPKAGGVK